MKIRKLKMNLYVWFISPLKNENLEEKIKKISYKFLINYLNEE